MEEKKLQENELQEKELANVSGGGGGGATMRCTECGKWFDAEGHFIQEKKGCLTYTYLVCPYCGEKYPW